MYTAPSNHSLAEEYLDISEFMRITGIILILLIMLVGTVGNSFVLYASLAYRAIDIDRISMILMENLAVADLLIVVQFLPTLMTLIGNKVLYGDIICFILMFSGLVPFAAESLTITMMACYRLYVILRAPLVPISHVYFIVAAVLTWFIPTLVAGVRFAILVKAHVFNPTGQGCLILNNTVVDVWVPLDLFITTGCIALPMFVTVLANIGILIAVTIIVRRLGHTLPNRSAVVTISWICWAFIFSYTPTFINNTLDESHGHEFSTWGILAVCCLGINVVSNPFIYILSNNRFKTFVVDMVSRRTREAASY